MAVLPDGWGENDEEEAVEDEVTAPLPAPGAVPSGGGAWEER